MLFGDVLGCLRESLGVFGWYFRILTMLWESLGVTWEFSPCRIEPRQVPRPTSFGKWGGGPMVLKVGNFSSQACTDQNSCGIGNCGTDLDFRTSQLAPCIAELRFHPPSAELELNLSRPPCAPRAPPVRPRPSISLHQ